MTLKTRLLLGSMGFVGLSNAAAHAAQPADAVRAVVSFRIAAQPLKLALRDFSLQSGIAVFADEAKIADKMSPGFAAASTPDAAMSALLVGTGLSQRRRDKVIVISRADAAAPQAYQAEPTLTPAQTVPAPAASPNDIVVTAQKRRESIQDVPIAISAFTQETLDKQKIEGGPDLLKAVPNLTFSKSNFAGYNLEIRGIGTKAISVSTDPGVAVNFNSTTLITNRFFEQEFFDLERVEVLRGPQGTLYGRNATGGVVNIISAKPDLTKFDGYIKGELGNFASKRAQGAINIPVIPDLFGIRIAGAWTKRDGFTTNDITMHRIDGRSLYTTRLTASLKPSSRLRSDFIWERFSEDDNRARTAKQLCHRDPGLTAVGKYTSLGPLYSGSLSQGCKDGSLYDDGAYGVPNGLSLPYVSLGQLVDINSIGQKPVTGEAVSILQYGVDPYASTTQTHDLRRISSAFDPIYRAKANVLEFNTNFSISDNLSLVAQSAYNTDRYYSTQDYNRFNTVPIFNSSDGLVDTIFGTMPTNFTPKGFFNDPQLGSSRSLLARDLVTANSKQFSQEVRISTVGSGRFQGTAGGNYTYYRNNTDYYVFVNTLTAFAQGFGGFSNNSANPSLCDNVRVALSGSGPVSTTSPEGNAADCLYVDPNSFGKINGQGHNYFRSSNRFHLNSFGLFGDGNYALTRDLKLLGGVRYNDDRKTTTPVPSQLLLGTSSALGGTVNYGYPTDPDIKQHFTAFTGRAGLQWSPRVAFTNNTMIYFTYSRGYKAGGTNPPPIGFKKQDPGSAFPPLVQTLSFPETFKPEYVNSLELGTKNTLLNNKLTVNLTGYFYKFRNYQVSQIEDRQAINENFNTKMYGLEGEFVYKPNRALTFNANVGLQNAKLDKHQQSIDVIDRLQGHGDQYALVKPFIQLPSNCVASKQAIEDYITRSGLDPNSPLGSPIYQICPGSAFSDRTIPSSAFPNGGRGFYANVGGNEVPNAPHFTINVGAEYNIPFARDWVVTPRVDFYHQAGSYARVYNDAIDRLRGWENVNVSLRVGNPEIGLLVEAYVKNLFDDAPITDAFINSDDTGLTTNVFTFDPRIIGVNVTKKF